MAAFFLREVRIDFLRAKPGLLFSPAQTFLSEDPAHAAALDGDLFVLVRIGGESVKAPAAKRQIQFPGPVQRRRHDLGALLKGVSGWTAQARGVFQGGQAACVERLEPVADRAHVQVQVGGNRPGGISLQTTPHHRRAFNQPGFSLAATRQLLNGGALLSVHLAQREHRPKSRGFHPSTYRENLPDAPLSVLE